MLVKNMRVTYMYENCFEVVISLTIACVVVINIEWLPQSHRFIRKP
jgi:hypothetical protein